MRQRSHSTGGVEINVDPFVEKALNIRSAFGYWLANLEWTDAQKMQPLNLEVAVADSSRSARGRPFFVL